MTHGTGPPARRPHLVVFLGPGWKYDETKRRFVKKGRAHVPVNPDLSAKCKVVYVAPDLVGVPESDLTPGERELARYVNLILPVDADAEDLLARVKKWSCVEDARVGPAGLALP